MKIAETKFGRWVIKEKAVPLFEQMAFAFNVSFDRAVEIYLQEKL